MSLSYAQGLLVAAVFLLMLSGMLALRAGGTRAGTWGVLLGLVLGALALGQSLALQGHVLARWLWWLSDLIQPALWLPLVIALANIGLLRRLVLITNALLAAVAVAAGAWLFGMLSWEVAPPGLVRDLPPEGFLLLAWAGVLGLFALLEALWQLSQRDKVPERRRMLVTALVVLLLVGGWALDAAAGLGMAPAAYGLALSGTGFVLLFVLLWIQRGPRRLSGTVSPALIHASRQPLLIADGEGRIQGANPAAARLLERRPYQVLGRALEQLIGLDVEHLDSATRLHGAGYVERVQIASGGRRQQREVAVQPLLLRAADGEVLAVLCTLNPGSEDPALSLTSLADPVTGLAGAALGEALIAQELRRHAGGSGPLVAAIFVRLDDAGVTAAEFGQVMHERLQSAVSERLGAVCDWPLDIARSAGGGFVMLLTQVADRAEVMAIAERAQQMLDKPFKLDQRELKPPVRLAVLPDLRIYHDLVDVLADARHGLEQARHAPGQPYVAEQRGHDRINLALAMESAIGTDAIDLRLEPVFDLAEARPLGARVRMRWAPEGMPALEDEALRRLARRVHLEGALNQWRLRHLAGRNWPRAWRLWLPVSVEELQTPAFIKAFPKALTSQPFRIVLELPDLAWQLPACRKVLGELMSAGIEAHAGEFSAGVRIVTQGEDLKPRSVGIEARLVQVHGPASDAALRGLTQTAQALGALGWAEGVRKKADLLRLQQAGVALVSGEYLAPDMDELGFFAWLQDEAAIRARFGELAASPRGPSGERRRPVVD